MSAVEMVAQKTQDSADAEEDGGEIGGLSRDGGDRGQAVDNHGPRLVDDAEGGEGHAHGEWQLEGTVAHVFALVEDYRNEEEEVSGRYRVTRFESARCLQRDTAVVWECEMEWFIRTIEDSR